jgi:hypothetical protein
MSAYLAYVNVFGVATRPSHRMAVQFEAMSVVNQTAEDRIGEGWLVDHGVPRCDGQPNVAARTLCSA